MDGELRIERGGRLTIPAAAARALGARPLRLTSWSEHHLLLETADPPGQVLLAGSLGEVGVVDLLSFCNMLRKNGLLHFRLAGGDKFLYFRTGEIVYAASTFPAEELGAILHGFGKLEPDQLQAARRLAGSRRALGTVLVEKGLVSSQDLWTATRSMVETIVYNLLTFQEGQFTLFARQLPEALAVRLSMNTQTLIMEGLRRFDERALYLQAIKSLDAVPVAAGPAPDDLDSTSRKLLALVAAGAGDVREVLRRGGVGDLDGLRLLSQLVERGLVTMEEVPTVPVAGELAEVITIFNGVLTAMHRVIAARNPQFRGEVDRFLRALPQPFSYVFRQVSLGEDGSLDGGRLVANLTGLGCADQLRLLTDAFSELINMECLAARRELGAADSAELVRRVQDVSQRVQTLMGRRDHE